MKPNPSAPEPHDALLARIGASLAAYIDSPDEAQLGRAYELGREALAQGYSIPEVVALHGQALRECIGTGTLDPSALHLHSSHLAELLSSYEMTHRGYRDAIAGLRHLNETLEREIQRIAHALHDEAGQLLVSVHLALAELEQYVQPEEKHRLRGAQGLLRETEQQLRRLSHELRPTILDDLGWLPAIEFLAAGVSKRTQVQVEVRATVSSRLSSAVETALYRTVQEALTNAARHARAARVCIEVARNGDTLRCSINDDGIGFDPDRAGGGLGLKGMRERLSAVNGILQINSSPGNGTRILLQLPMDP